MSVFPDCHAFFLLQCSQHIAAERSFSRLPTHPYVQWWNVVFTTINNSSFLPFSVSVYTVILESVEEWSPEDLPLFPFLGQYKMLVFPSSRFLSSCQVLLLLSQMSRAKILLLSILFICNFFLCFYKEIMQISIVTLFSSSFF